MKLFNKYKFSDKSQTLGGMISTVMGLAALVSFGYCIQGKRKCRTRGRKPWTPQFHAFCYWVGYRTVKL